MFSKSVKFFLKLSGMVEIFAKIALKNFEKLQFEIFFILAVKEKQNKLNKLSFY